MYCMPFIFCLRVLHEVSFLVGDLLSLLGALVLCNSGGVILTFDYMNLGNFIDEGDRGDIVIYTVIGYIT